MLGDWKLSDIPTGKPLSIPVDGCLDSVDCGTWNGGMVEWWDGRMVEWLNGGI